MKASNESLTIQYILCFLMVMWMWTIGREALLGKFENDEMGVCYRVKTDLDFILKAWSQRKSKETTEKAG